MNFFLEQICLSGGENVGCRCRDIRYPLATVSWYVGVQQFRYHVFESEFYGSLVPHVRQNLRLHQQVNIFKCLKKSLYAPSEVRTHDLEIMRLARCLLRYRGLRGNGIKQAK